MFETIAADSRRQPVALVGAPDYVTGKDTCRERPCGLAVWGEIRLRFSGPYVSTRDKCFNRAVGGMCAADVGERGCCRAAFRQLQRSHHLPSEPGAGNGTEFPSPVGRRPNLLSKSVSWLPVTAALG